MKTFFILGERDGVRACMSLKTDGEWLPLSIHDLGKTANFIPEQVHELCIRDEFGQRRFAPGHAREGWDQFNRGAVEDQDADVMDAG